MKKKIAVMFTSLLVLTMALPIVANAAPNGESCWGQVSAVAGQTGELGAHSSSQTNPRIGLKNLAVALADAGIIEDDSMAALGAFVADADGLVVEACS